MHLPPSSTQTSLVARILRTHPTLLHNPDLSPPHRTSNTTLHLACSLGLLPIVNLLLSLGHESQGISLNAQHQTPLMLAAKEGKTEVVYRLCEWGATSSIRELGVNGFVGAALLRRDVRGRTALMYAAEGGHDTVVQILLTFAPVPPPPPGPIIYGLTSEQKASAALANSNVMPHSKDGYARPAMEGNNESAVQHLLAQTDIDGNTALHFACAFGHLLVLRTLLAAGADPEIRNGWAWMPVEYSLTVEAEKYFRGLVIEMERRREVEVEKGGVGRMGVRLVEGD
jgi:ankyrin repeat protein